MEACENGNETIAAELLSHGADARAEDIFGDRALALAERFGHAGVVKHLCSVHREWCERASAVSDDSSEAGGVRGVH
ncbi:hypothetical protein DIPPA_33424 [Diplonema papillatum]|nr:hypothetical protein DIPPA_33424 [Diplonema papillatum]